MTVRGRATAAIGLMLIGSYFANARMLAADEPKPETKALDQAVYAGLRDVINAGAELYNPPAYDRIGCYRLYQGAIVTLRPLLAHRPELQTAIDQSLTDAEQEARVGERAFLLRAAIDKIRAETNPKKGEPKKAAESKPSVDAKPEAKKEPPR